MHGDKECRFNGVTNYESLDNGCRKARECVCSASAASTAVVVAASTAVVAAATAVVAAAAAASVTDSVPVRVKWCLGNQSVTI